MKVCFLGGYNPSYPRNTVIRKGFRAHGIAVSQCWLPPGYKSWMRYPLLFFRSWSCLSGHDLFFVPEFCQKDVPLAKFISFFAGRKVIFDPLASRFETKILDWKRKPPHSWQARWNFRIDSWAFRLSNLVLADTHAHKEYYCQDYRLPDDKVEVVPVGYDSDLFQRISDKERQGGDKFKVLFFGSFLPLHGVKTIIQSARILSRKDSSVFIKLIGSGQTRPESQALASRWSLDNVHFEGWLPQESLPQQIAQADICLGIFGKGEKARRVVPHKIFQAMAMGKAVVTLRTPAVEEFFHHREDIFLCPSSHPSEVAQAVLELKRDSELRRKVAEGGYDLVSQKFSPEAIGSMLIDILKRHHYLSSQGLLH
jgi:glycosyltransferase involved in cell wall biosynthesis